MAVALKNAISTIRGMRDLINKRNIRVEIMERKAQINKIISDFKKTHRADEYANNQIEHEKTYIERRPAMCKICNQFIKEVLDTMDRSHVTKRYIYSVFIALAAYNLTDWFDATEPSTFAPDFENERPYGFNLYKTPIHKVEDMALYWDKIEK